MFYPYFILNCSMKKSVLVLLLLLFSFTLSAQLNTDRPSLSDNSYTLKPGSFQNENGFQINAVENASNKTNFTGTLPYSSFRLGFLKGFELRMATALLRNPQNSTSQIGFADLEIGTKIQIIENVAWISHLGIPNGNKDFSNGKLYSSHKVSATLNTEKSAFVFNTGVRFSRNRNSGEKERNWLTTLVGINNINKNTFVFAECFLNDFITGKGIDQIKIWQPGFDFGFGHKLTSNTQIDFAYGYIAQQPFINLGFSWGAFNKTKSKIRRTITPDF